jgi:hypothetical protein
MRFSMGSHHLGPRRITKLFGSCTAALLLTSTFAFQANAIVLNFANLAGTEIDFTGGAFSFTSVGGYQFDITSVSGGVGDSVSLNGGISPGGPFTIGTITSPAAGEETAPVTGTGTLYITDGASLNLLGSIQWSDITTFNNLGVLNLTGTINLTGITYGGANHDLQALAAAGSASDVVSFQFLPAETLDELKAATGAGDSTSYSGSIVVVPEPGTLTLAGLGLAGLAALRLRRKK